MRYSLKRSEKGKVFLPKILLIVGCIGASFFLVLSILVLLTDESWWMSFAFLPFSLLGVTLIIAFINCRISYDENRFVVRNFWGLERTYTYDRITGIKEGVNDTYIYIGKRKVIVEMLSIGGMQFIIFVHQKYRLLHNGQSVPEMRNDIFNGNVKDASGVIAAYVLVGGFLLGATIYCLAVFLAPDTAENSIEQQVIFQEIVMADQKIILTSSDNYTYQIRCLENDKMNELCVICDGKTVVTVYVQEVTPDEADDYYSIKAILHEGQFLLTFDETNKAQREEIWPFVCILLAFMLIWGAYIAASIVVGRNPNKYGKKVVGIFFKDGYVKF